MIDRINPITKSENGIHEAKNITEQSSRKKVERCNCLGLSLEKFQREIRRLLMFSKNTQKELIRQNALCHLLFEQSSQAILIASFNGRISRCNNNFSRLFGFKPKHVVGSFSHDIIVPDELLNENSKIRRIVQGGVSMYTETYRLNSKKEKIPVALTACPLVIDGHVKGIIFKYRLISEQNQYGIADQAEFNKGIQRKDAAIRNSNMEVQPFVIDESLLHAIEQGELILHYQPIMAGNGQLIQGFESLVRWEHPDRGLIFPEDFIPKAERTGMIIPLGRYVLEMAICQIKEWESYFIKHSLTLSVNVSAKQLLENTFSKYVLLLIERYRINPEHLQLEVTESVLMNDSGMAIEQLKQIREAGIRLMIDDFGTGYSSLAYLHQLPVDTLKIDKSFIQRINKAETDNEIVKTIISLAKKLKLKVVAEGVEETEQFDYLKPLSCDYMQGYMFSKPLGEQKISDMLMAME